MGMQLSPTDVRIFADKESVSPVRLRSRNIRAAASLPDITEGALARVAEALPCFGPVEGPVVQAARPVRANVVDRLIGTMVGSFLVFAVLSLVI